MIKILLSVLLSFCLSISVFAQNQPYRSLFFKLSCDSVFTSDTLGNVLQGKYFPRVFTINALIGHDMTTSMFNGQIVAFDAIRNERYSDGLFVFDLPGNEAFYMAIYSKGAKQLIFVPRDNNGTYIYWKVKSFEDLDPNQYIPK